MNTQQNQYTAFAGERQIASGELKDVALQVKQYIDQGGAEQVLVFADETGQQRDLDLRGTPAEVLARLAPVEDAETEPQATVSGVKSGPGRPKMGVVAREVTLLPRHWEWLNAQPGGASVTLRKLVEHARRNNQGAERARRAQDAAYRFMNVMAGNLPEYEEALRAFYAGKYGLFEELSQEWPTDIRTHARKLVHIAAKAASDAATRS